jgi:hypothetical protein
MTPLDPATQTQIANIERHTGTDLANLLAAIGAWGLDGHKQILTRAKEEFGVGHGDANLLAHLYRRGLEAPAAPDAGADPVEDALASIYAGRKEGLRPLHDLVMARIASLGTFEIAPKKAYLSLRRRKQFATVGPGTKGRLEVGLNAKGVPATARREALPDGSMCTHRVFVAGAEDVDEEFLAYVREAFVGAA